MGFQSIGHAMRASALFLGIVSAMSLVVAGISWVMLDAERQRSAELSTKLDKAAGQVLSLQSRLDLASTSAAEPLSAPAERGFAAEQPFPVGVVSSTSPSFWRPGTENHRVSDAAYDFIRLQLPQRYPGLQSELGLSPSQTGKLFDLLVAQEKKYGDLSESLRGSAENVRARSFADLKLQQDAELSALLGAKHLQFEEYTKTQAERVQVASLGKVMVLTGEALRDDQVQSLTKAIIEQRQRLKLEEQQERHRAAEQSREVSSEAISDLRAEADKRILSAASAYLSERQQQVLRSQLEVQSRFSGSGAPPPATFPLLGGSR